MEETRTRMIEGKEPQAVQYINNGNVDDHDVYRRELFFEYTRALTYMHLDVSIQSVGKLQIEDKKTMRHEVKKLIEFLEHDLSLFG